MSDETHGPVEWQEFGAASIDGVGVLDGDEYIYTNRSFADIYGYDDPDELVGTAWQDRYGSDERERIKSEVLPQVHEEGHWRGESVDRRRDGGTMPLELSLRATGNGFVVCVVREGSPEESAKDELERYETVIDTVDDGIYSLDEDLRFPFVNDALCEMVGRSREATVPHGRFGSVAPLPSAVLARPHRVARREIVAGGRGARLRTRDSGEITSNSASSGRPPLAL